MGGVANLTVACFVDHRCVSGDDIRLSFNLSNLLDFGFKRAGSQIELDIYGIGLGDKIEGLLRELVAGPGAVRATMKRCLNSTAKL